MEKDLFADSPQETDLFARSPERDLFSSEETDLFGTPEATLMDTVRSIPERFSVGLHTGYQGAKRLFTAQAEGFDPEQIETFKANPESPAAQEYFRMVAENEQVKRDQMIAEEAMQAARPTGEETGVIQKAAGGAAESFGSSLVGVGTFAATRNPALALTVGGGTGFLTEAGGIRREAELAGATPEQAGRVAGFGGFTAALLDNAQLGFMIKGAGAGRAAARFVASEYPSEAIPSALTNIAGNIEGYQDKSVGQILSEANIEGVAGLMGAGVMAGPIHLMDRAQQKKAVEDLTAQEQSKAQAEGLATETLETTHGVVIDPVDETSVPRVQLSPAATRLAELEQRQKRVASAWEVPPENVEWANSINERFTPPLVNDLGGITPGVAATRQKYLMEEEMPITNKPIVSGRASGLTLAHLGQLEGGTVIGVMTPSEENEKMFPAAGRAFYEKNAKEWVDTFMPGAKVVLNYEVTNPKNEQGGVSQVFGNHQYIDGIHFITPKELPSLQEKYDGGDARTRSGAMLGFAHEFGHALKIEKFIEGIQENLRFQVRSEIDQGFVSPETLTTLQGTVEGELLARWMGLRQRVLDGSMTAQEFMEQWVGPRKLAWGVLRQKAEGQDSMLWGKEKVNARGIAWEAASAVDLIKAAYAPPMTDFGFGADFREADYLAAQEAAVETALNFDEFMAEQFSRAALERDFFSKNQNLRAWFKKALDALRGFFTYLKKTQIIAPTTEFGNWLDAQTRLAATQRKNTRIKIPAALQRKRAELLAQIEEKKAADAAEKKRKKAEEEGLRMDESAQRAPEAPDEEDLEETVPTRQEQVAIKDPVESMYAALEDLVIQGIIEADAPIYNTIGKFIQKGDLETARKLINKQIDKHSNYDLEYTTRMLEQLPNKNVLKTEYMKTLLNQKALRKQDKVIVEEMLRQYPNGVPVEAIMKMVEENVLPLTRHHLNRPAPMGIHRVAEEDWRNASDGTTTVLSVPFRTTTDHHFASTFTNYIGHVSYFDEGTTRKLTQVQSDFFQRDRQTLENVEPEEISIMKELEGEITDLRPFITDLYKVHQAGPQTTQEYVQELHALRDDADFIIRLPSVRDEVMAEFYRAITQALAGNSYSLMPMLRILTKYRAGLVEQVQQYENRLAAASIVGGLDREAVESRWWERFIQEMSAEAYESGQKTVWFPTVETAKVLQNWHPLQLRIMPHLQGLTLEIEEGYDFLASPVTPTGRVRSYGDSGVNLEVVDQNGKTAYVYERDLVKEDGSHIELTPEEMSVKPVMEEWGDLEGLRQRYATVIPKFLKEHFKAKTITDKNGYTWYAWDTAYKASRVTLWDRENPLSPNINNITPAQVASLTDEQLADPKTVATATELWQKKGWSSPFFQRWFRGSRATQYDGTPLQLWAGLGSTLQELQVGGQRITWFHTARDNAVFDTVTKGWKDNPAARVQNYALRMLNPLMRSKAGNPLNEVEARRWVEEAQAKGHDGLIITDVRAPHLGSIYAVFNPEDAKALLNTGTFDETDRLHWDQESPTETQIHQGVKAIWKFAKGLYPANWPTLMNAAARALDGVIQLQQRVLTPLPDGTFDAPLRHFGKLMQLSQRMKNNLQVDGEELAKEIQKLPKAEYELFSRAITDEFKAGKVLTQVDAVPGTILKHVHTPTSEWIDYLAERGITDTPQGQRLASLVLRYKNVIQGQLDALHRTFESQLQDRLEDQPNVLQVELAKLDAIMRKYREVPFVPQGRYGDYVLIVKEKVWDEERQEHKRVVVRQEHFTTEAKRRAAYVKAKELEKSGRFFVTTRDLQGYTRSMMMVPSDMLEQLSHTQAFTEQQLEELAEVMHMPAWQRLESRYDNILSKVAGAETDVLRNFANFVWHNSNFIWKTYYRKEFTKAVLWQQKEIRDLERRSATNPAEAEAIAEMVNFRRRNEAIMKKVQESVLYPEEEFQGMRMMVSLAYLAYNLKTAALNVSTQLLTANAITSQYGELNGAKLLAQSYRDAMSLVLGLDSRIKSATGKEQLRLLDLKAAVDRAGREGVVDPSYAFFLAGQANDFDIARAFKRSQWGQYGHLAIEKGMMPFRLVELGNRYHAFIAFYNAERAEGKPMQTAYERAVEQVNSTQNSFTQANKPELFRGKKSIFLVFASFTQFMMYHSLGGYERQMRARNEQERAEAAEAGRPLPRKHANWWHGETMKLYLVYAMLAGLSGVPFGEDILNIVSALWKKFFPEKKDFETVLRQEIADLGGNPDRWMHGWTHDVWGFDISGSIGLGRMLPFASGLARTYRSPEEALGYGVLSMAGPTGGFLSDVAKVIGMGWQAAHDAPVTGGEMLKELPGAWGGLGRAVDAYYKQEVFEGHGVTTKAGESLTIDPVTGEPRNLTEKELVGMLLNFNPTITSVNRERNFAENQEVIYWNTRRGTLLENYKKAKIQLQDEKVIDEVLARIEDFNDQVPDPALRITGKTRAKAVQEARIRARMEEQGTQRSRAERTIKRGIAPYYGVSGEQDE